METTKFHKSKFFKEVIKIGVHYIKTMASGTATIKGTQHPCIPLPIQHQCRVPDPRIPLMSGRGGATHFEVNVDATREAGDDIWFELVDGKTTRPMQFDFGTKLALPANIQRPKKLRIYINQSAEFNHWGTFVHAVYWNVCNDTPPNDQTILFGVDWKSSPMAQ